METFWKKYTILETLSESDDFEFEQIIEEKNPFSIEETIEELKDEVIEELSCRAKNTGELWVLLPKNNIFISEEQFPYDKQIGKVFQGNYEMALLSFFGNSIEELILYEIENLGNVSSSILVDCFLSEIKNCGIYLRYYFSPISFE
jgi:hypothetical protein